jgi:hypothetical protein
VGIANNDRLNALSAKLKNAPNANAEKARQDFLQLAKRYFPVREKISRNSETLKRPIP